MTAEEPAPIPVPLLPPRLECLARGVAGNEASSDADAESSDTDESNLEIPDPGVEVYLINGAQAEPMGSFIPRIKANCWYMPATLNGSVMHLLVDSGSQVTIISSESYAGDPNLRKLGLRDPGPWTIRGISGRDLPVKGIITLPMTVGSHTYTTDALVANIDCSGMLGMNFLESTGIQFNFKTGCAELEGEDICLSRRDRVRTCQVRVARTTVVPPRSESVVWMTPKRQKIMATGSSYLMKPRSSFAEDTGLVLGRTLVTGDSRGVPALVFNPSDESVTLEKGCTAGTCVQALCVKERGSSPVSAPECSSSEDSDASDGENHSSASEPTTQRLAPHLEQMISRSRVKQGKRKAVRELVAQYTDVFASPDGKMGRTDIAHHHIDLVDPHPVKQRLRRAAQAHQEIIDREVTHMLDEDVVEPSDSPWASPVVMVKKKDGSWRFCVDYRKLNDNTRKDSYPLPNIDDTFDSLAGSRYFCALDLASGYWQVKMADADKEKTAFITKQGLFQFKVMPFGLCNAPATFERLMELVLKGYLWKRCLVYIDDVVVYGRSFRETLTNLRLVLERIRAAGLKLKPSKCELFRKEILYLGFMVTGKGVRPDPSKVAKVRHWPRPCNQVDVRAFLGFAGYHRRFVQGFAEIAKPLTELTAKNAPFEWGGAQQRAFLLLREALSTCPVLYHPVPSAEFILDTDASNFAAGGVLSQVVDGVERVIAYSSIALNRAQMNYCTTHRELLAVVLMTQRYRHYLLGRRFRLRTDHSSLRWLLNYRDIDGMLARWLVKLQEYDMAIEHRPGKLHGNADGLSRCHKCKNPECAGNFQPDTDGDTPSDSELCYADVLPVRSGCGAVSSDFSGEPEDLETAVCRAGMHGLVTASRTDIHVRLRATELDNRLRDLPYLGGYSSRDIAEKQRADPSIGPIYLAVEKGEKPALEVRRTFNSETQALVARWNQLRIQAGLLYRAVIPPWQTRTIMQLVLPRSLRTEVLHQLHDLRVVGHLGIQRTVARVQQRFYWPGCTLDVARWCAACPQCAGRKGKPAPGRIPMQNIKVGAPFDMIALDILDTHRVTPRGYRYILVLSDYFTKWTDAFPLRRQTAEECAKLLLTRFVVYHGVPKRILTDQGTQFESTLFRSLASALGSEKVHTVSYRPQTDGQVERFNRSVLNMLSAFVCDRANDWDQHLPFVLMAYRSSVHSSTGCTPFMMLHGREQNLPVDVMFPTAAETGPGPQCGPEYVEWMRRAIATAHEFARAHLDKAALRQKRGYDAHAKERGGFVPGDKVRYYYPPARQGNKFGKPWIGPFTVVKKVTDVDYKIRRDSDPRRVIVTHLDHLKPYEGPLALDLNIQRPGPDNIELPNSTGQSNDPLEQAVRWMADFPESAASVMEDSDSEGSGAPSADSAGSGRPAVRRSARKTKGQPPTRLGWG